MVGKLCEASYFSFFLAQFKSKYPTSSLQSHSHKTIVRSKRQPLKIGHVITVLRRPQMSEWFYIAVKPLDILVAIKTWSYFWQIWQKVLLNNIAYPAFNSILLHHLSKKYLEIYGSVDLLIVRSVCLSTEYRFSVVSVMLWLCSPEAASYGWSSGILDGQHLRVPELYQAGQGPEPGDTASPRCPGPSGAQSFQVRHWAS